MITDFPYIFWWWFSLFLLGIVFFPITSKILFNFNDKGYPFAKVFGILILSFSAFLLAIFKIAPLSFLTLMGILVVTIPASYLLSKRIKHNETHEENASLRTFLRKHWVLLTFEEVGFFCALAFWSYIRGFAPEIHGLEKFMDFGFVNSIIANKYLPPLDIWLTKAPDYPGYFINYYYFGHFYTAVLTVLTRINSAITYNLMIATVFAFTAVCSFSLGSNLFAAYTAHYGIRNKKKLSIFLTGILAAFLITFGGNLHTIYSFFEAYPNDDPKPIPPFTYCKKTTDSQSGNITRTCKDQVKFSPFTFPNGYWYPNATRFIPNTIHEFPMYSFVVSDLHGHVSDIPFVMFTLAILLNVITTKQKTAAKAEQKDNKEGVRQIIKTTLSSFQYTFGYPILLGFMLAVMYMTNAWDGLIYMVLSGLVFLYLFTHRTNDNRSLYTDWKKMFIYTGLLVLSFILFATPFSAHFKVFVTGIGVVCPPEALAGRKIGPFLFEEAKTHCDRSPLWMMLMLWGFFLYSAVGFLCFIMVRKTITVGKIILRTTTFFCTIPFVGSSIHQWLHGEEDTKAENSKNKKQEINNTFPVNIAPADIFMTFMILISAALLIFPEFFYAKDIYPLHYRANTMFKLGYQAFMMMMIGSAYIYFRIMSSEPVSTVYAKMKKYVAHTSTSFRFSTFIWIVGFFGLFSLVALYPYFAIYSYYNNLTLYKGLNGITWMKSQYADDYNAILWLREQISQNNIAPQSVIAEAVGESYTDFARFSSYTGLPTIIGWPVHEWLWRGTYDEAGKRIPLVEKIYTSENANDVTDLLKKYHVSYVIVGTLERQKYPTLTESVFKQIGDIIYQSGSTKIYRLR